MKSMWIELRLRRCAVLVRQALVRSRRRARCGWRRSRPAACRRRPSRAGRCGPRGRRARPRRAATRPRRTRPAPRITPPPCSASISTARPALEPDLEPADDRPVGEHERLRRAHVPVGPLRVGRRVDLLGGQVREVDDPVHGLVARGVEASRSPAGRSSGRCRALRSGARRSRARSARPAAAVSASARSFQAATGSGSSSRQTWATCSQSRSKRLVRRQVGEDEARPRLGRAGHDRPVGRPVVDHLQDLLDERKLVAPGALRVEVVEQPGRRRPGERDARRPLLAEREHPVRRTTTARTRACRRPRYAIRARLTYGSKYWTSTNFAPRL